MRATRDRSSTPSRDAFAIVIVGRRFKNLFITCIACRRIADAASDDHRSSSPSPRPKPALPMYCDRPLMRPTAAAAPNVAR